MSPRNYVRRAPQDAESLQVLSRSTRFGELLREYRQRRGFSQEHLAEKARISVEAVGALERGTRRAPYRSTVRLLSAALGLDEEQAADFDVAASEARARVETVPEPSQNNLLPQLTSFVDREKELAEIKKLLDSHRLVTLVGAGGCGKTRCAIEIAPAMLDRFSNGVWLAELAPISDPPLISSVIARALRVQESPNRPILETLLAYLRRKHLLLVLDNCEHVIEEARRVVTTILIECPNVCILATSRESLSIAGEHAYRVPSLPVPSTSEFLSAEQLSQYGAVQLFSDRAVSADNRFVLTIDTAPHVADICRLLDGIPLAIELAAVRVKMLSPKELAQKLEERFRVLTAGHRSALPRHRTMRALIDWSYDLLSRDEGAFFRKISIFAGGFTLETAAAVCADGEIDEIAVLDVLSSLVDKSLIQAEAVGGDTRYSLLETTRQYAREKLSDTGEEERIAHAHARAFLALAEHLDKAWEITPDRPWNAQAEPELENFRAALSWAFGENGDVLLGQRMAGALRRVWYSFALGEGRRWVRAAQQRVTSNTPDAVLAALDIAEAGIAAMLAQRQESVRAAERALLRYRELADLRGIANAEMWIGWARIFLGEIGEGEALTTQALETARSVGSRRLVGSALQKLALARRFDGDIAGARQRFAEALAVARDLGADGLAATIALNLAETEFRAGNAAAALQLSNEALGVALAVGDTRVVVNARYNMAAYLVALRRYDEARTAAREALSGTRDMQWSAGVAFTLQHLAAIAALRPNAAPQVTEDRRHAARILGYVGASLCSIEALREYTEQQEYEAMISALRAELGEEELAKLMDQGSTWSEDQAIAEAMLI